MQERLERRFPQAIEAGCQTEARQRTGSLGLVARAGDPGVDRSLTLPWVGCDNMVMIETPDIMMAQVLTLQEIQARYAPEWVLVGDPQTDDEQQLKSGRVLYHSAHGDEVCRKAMEFPPGRYALRFLGERPVDVVMVL